MFRTTISPLLRSPRGFPSALVAAAPLSTFLVGAAPALAQATPDITLVPAKSVPVPGCVEVAGGRTSIGTSEKEAEEILQAHFPNFTRAIDAQTPQHTVDVDAFWIGRFELTNAEYELFVKATERRPPLGWIDPEAERTAATEHARQEEEKFQAAKAAGRVYEKRAWAVGEGRTPRDAWWEENWRTIGYKIPKDGAKYPVVYVNYDDASSYCAWAGLRLPTEFEFDRAARKDTKSIFPWGDDWEDGKFAATQESRRRATAPVGSFEAGASPLGVHDLAGNVWEWTSSPYVAFKGFKQNEYSLKINGKREKATAPPKWDADQRVVKGSSFEEPKVAARISTRRGTARTQATGAMGFRVAASPEVCVDAAAYVNDRVLRNAAGRPEGVTFAPEQVTGIDRWKTNAIGVEGYDRIFFVPVSEIAEGSDAEFRRNTLEAPAPLGYFSTTVEMIDPPLPAGEYFVEFRAKGKPPREDKQKDKADGGASKEKEDPDQDPAAEEQQSPTEKKLAGLDLEKDWILFIHPQDGSRVAAVEPKDGLAWKTGITPGKVTARAVNERITSSAGGAKLEPRTYIDFSVGVLGKVRNRQMPLTLSFRPADTVKGGAWRQQ